MSNRKAYINHLTKINFVEYEPNAYTQNLHFKTFPKDCYRQVCLPNEVQIQHHNGEDWLTIVKADYSNLRWNEELTTGFTDTTDKRKPITREFDAEFLQEDVLCGANDAVDTLIDEIVGSGRWSTYHRLVFSYEGKYYETDYSRGATENQDEYPFEDADRHTCKEVETYTKYVPDYREVYEQEPTEEKSVDIPQPLIEKE